MTAEINSSLPHLTCQAYAQHRHVHTRPIVDSVTNAASLSLPRCHRN